MRNLILLPLLVLSFACYSQSVGLGLKAGANISNFSNADFGDLKSKALFSFHGGAYLNIGLGNIYIQPELLVSTIGAKLDSATGSDKLKLTYLSVPVMVKYKGASAVYFEIGPQFSFKLSEDLGNQSINNFAKDLDLSAAAGIGLQSKAGLGIGARYLVGLSKVGDFDAGNFDPDFKNSVLQISIIIAISTKK